MRRKSHLTPESKQQSVVRRHTSPPKMHKSKQTISTRKITCTVCWDRQGVLVVEFLPQGTTINSTAYCKTMKKFRCAIQDKRRGMITCELVLLHGNARLHTAPQTQALITSFGWEQFDPLPQPRLSAL